MLPNPSTIRRAKPLLGTIFDISLESASHSSEQLRDIASRCFQRVSKIHRMMSYFDPESEISRINHSPVNTRIAVSPETRLILQMALELYTKSSGAFDIQHRGRSTYPDATVSIYADGTVSRSHCAEIDLGGIAKGFAADEAARIASADDAISGVINAGGDIVFFGPRPQPLSIRSPRFDGTLFSAGSFSNCAVATSVFNQDYEPISISVRAPSCLIADALTKALQLQSQSGIASLLNQYHAQFMQINSQLSICAGAPLH